MRPPDATLPLPAVTRPSRRARRAARRRLPTSRAGVIACTLLSIGNFGGGIVLLFHYSHAHLTLGLLGSWHP